MQPLIGLCLLVVLGVFGRLELLGKPDRKEPVQEAWESIRGDAGLPILRLTSALPIVVVVPLMMIGRLCDTLISILVTLRP